MKEIRLAFGPPMTQLKGTLYVAIMPQSQPRTGKLHIATFWSLNQENFGLMNRGRLASGLALTIRRDTLYVGIMPQSQPRTERLHIATF